MTNLCRKCKLEFSRLSKYNSHIKRCLGSPRNYCKFCQVSLVDFKVFQRYIRTKDHCRKKGSSFRQSQCDLPPSQLEFDQQREEIEVDVAETYASQPSEYELRRLENIQERKMLEQTLFSNYYGESGGPSVSRQIMEEMQESETGQELQSEDSFDSANLESDKDDWLIKTDREEIVQKMSDNDLGSVSDFSEVQIVRRSQRVQQHNNEKSEKSGWDGKEMDCQHTLQNRFHSPPPPEDNRKEPWDFVNVDIVKNWREFCCEEFFQKISQIDSNTESIESKRGPYKTITMELDQMLQSKCTRRFVEWRRKSADGLSNEALNQLLSILHDADCDLNLFPRNHYQLEQFQNHALKSFIPKSTRWRIPKMKSNSESKEISVIDIADLIRLQLQDQEISSIITTYNNNDVISHPSHSEIWKKLVEYDNARDCKPLFLKLYFDDYQSQYYKERQSAGLYLTIANLPPKMQRSMSNQHVVCLLSPTADRRSALAIAFDMIWKLEKSPIVFELGNPNGENSRLEQFQVHLFALPADRKGSSEMIWHMGVAATRPCHSCDIEKKDQCEIVLMGDSIKNFGRKYDSLLFNILRGCDFRYNHNNIKAARKIQTETGFYNVCLPPSMWSKFFNPISQTPPCLMHNGPLGLIRTMILQFAEVHDQAFVQHVNNATSTFSFHGITRAPYGIFCESKGSNGGRRGKYTLRKLNVDQIMGFARSSPAFVWQVLPKTHFDLWMLVLKWFSTLYALEFRRDNLDCGGIAESFCTHGENRCIRHMGRFVIKQWLSVFSHLELEHHRFSQSFWNLHVQMHMFRYIQQLGPLYLLSTDLGESHHAVQKRFGLMTNHQHGSMEVQTLKKNLIIAAWRFYNGRDEIPEKFTATSSHAIDERSLHSELYSSASINALIMAVINHTWDIHLTKEKILKEGKLFKKMRIHGHFISVGANIAVRHGEMHSTPWFARIVRFIRFLQDDGQQRDIAEICWYNAVDISIVPLQNQDVYLNLSSSGCIILKEMPKNSKDFIATTQILFHADIDSIVPIPGQKIPNFYIYNPWTSNRFFSPNNIEISGILSE